MEAGENGLTRGTWFVARRARGGRGRRTGVDFVVCFWGGGLFRVCFFQFFYCLLTHTACCKYEPPCLIYLSTSTGMRTGCHYLISLSACLSVCMRNIRRYY